MCNSSIGSLKQALIQLQYALGDYYSCGKRAAEFSPLDASLCVLREACVARRETCAPQNTEEQKNGAASRSGIC